MPSNRLEAFSDGVLAIIITIMVLELRPPDEATFAALGELLPNGLAYLLSFVFVAIYWNNHHHLLQVVERVDGMVLWANMHLLLWLSLVPFATAWLGEHPDRSAPVTTYGVILLGAAVAYQLLTRTLLRLHGDDSALTSALGHDRKGVASAVAYVVAIPASLLLTWSALAIFVGVAVVWLIPDRRISRAVSTGPDPEPPSRAAAPGTAGEPPDRRERNH